MPGQPLVDLETQVAETETEQTVDADGNPIEPEVDEDGNPIEDEPAAEDDVETAPRRSGGGSQTIREQRRARQEAEKRAAALERENAELRGFQAGATSRQQQADPQAAARAEQEFYQSLELMPPSQAYQAVVQRERQQFGAAFQQLQFNQQDLADQTRFEASCARSPVRETYREKVEAYRQDQLRRGFIISREESFHLLYGRELEARSNRAAPRQRVAAAARVAGQRTRPTGARGDVSPGGRRPAPGSAEADWAAINAAVARGEKVF